MATRKKETPTVPAVPVINERERQIETQQKSILERAASLMDKQTRRIVVRSQEEANLASSLIHDAAEIQAVWREDPTNYGTRAAPGEIPRLNQAHAARVTAWRKLHDPLQRVIDGSNFAVSFWIRDEQRKRDEAAAKIEAKERKKEPAFVAPREKVEVAGISTATRWDYEIVWCEGKDCTCTLVGQGQFHDETVFKLHYKQGFHQLVKAAAKDEKLLMYLLDDEKALRHLATDKHDMAGKDGYLLPGVRCVEIEGVKRKP